MVGDRYSPPKKIHFMERPYFVSKVEVLEPA